VLSSTNARIAMVGVSRSRSEPQRTGSSIHVGTARCVVSASWMMTDGSLR